MSDYFHQFYNSKQGAPETIYDYYGGTLDDLFTKLERRAVGMHLRAATRGAHGGGGGRGSGSVGA